MTAIAPALVKPSVDHDITHSEMHFNFSDERSIAW